jgi:hypothetical protein
MTFKGQMGKDGDQCLATSLQFRAAESYECHFLVVVQEKNNGDYFTTILMTCNKNNIALCAV